MAKKLPEIQLIRAYDAGQQDCGYRVLVDRLWPRGLSKEELHLDEWAKEVAPSTELRQWFGHRPERWQEFRRRYRQELRERPEPIDHLVQLSKRRRVALLYGARDTEHNHAIVLCELLESKRSARKGSR
ncbi:MAG: DUF488 family protein [Pirellulales bacterium]|nr:DUF488 family protein [Pirellulales bacterium]